jgi:signal transduction histidine kinase/ActR/RegA family two-component response regulator
VQEDAAVDWPWSPLGELGALIGNFRAMTRALRTRFQELQIEIGERRSTQEKLLAATAAAEGASRAKSEFLANMSHEIRTPLGAVLGFAGLMAKDDLASTERRECVAAIQRNGEQLFRLIDDVLDFSKIEAGHIRLEPAVTTLDDILSGSIDLSERIAREKGLGVVVHAATPLPSALIVDPTRLKQILLNVVGNAVKFSEKGDVVVSLACETAGVGSRKAMLSIQVADRGIGLSGEDAAKLFTAFGQADSSSSRRFGGTGLGLVLSRRIAQAMGGDVRLVRGGRGDGCTFDITVAVELPFGAAQAATIDAVRAAGRRNYTAASEERPLLGLSLLVVEDAADNRLLLKRVLTRLGADAVEVADSGLAGVRQATGRRFDVVLMDIQMPDVDGLEATRMLRSQGYRGPIIALTAHALQDDRRRCLDAGLDDYLAKPVDWTRLAEVIVRLSGERRGREDGGGVGAAAAHPPAPPLSFARPAEAGST